MIYAEELRRIDAAVIESQAAYERDLRRADEADREIIRGQRILLDIIDNDEQMRFIGRVGLHEAGHVYALWVASVPINEVGLRFANDPPRCIGGYVDRGAYDDQDAAGIALAGIAAEREAGLSPMGGTDADRRKAFALYYPDVRTIGRIDEFMEREIRRQQALLRKAWPGIRSLADAITTRLILSGAEAEQIMVRALGAASAA